MTDPRVLLDAEFDPRVKSYWIWQPVLILSLFIVTIPIAIIYAVVSGYFIDRYLAGLHCTLTERTLEIKKGIFNKKESTIPLEKITDLQLFQGPVMRHFGIHGFKVETAGQSNAGGDSLVNLIGIVATPEFRKAVLDQRDRSARATAPATAGTVEVQAAGPSSDVETHTLLSDIRDTLVRIERALGQGERG